MLNKKTRRVISSWSLFESLEPESVDVAQIIDNTDHAYLQKTLDTRNPGGGIQAGSVFQSPQTAESLKSASWSPLQSSAINPPGIAFTAQIPGTLGVTPIDALPPGTPVRFQLSHGGAGGKSGVSMEVVAQFDSSLSAVESTTLIAGPSRDDPSKYVVWTFHPGDPSPMGKEITQSTVLKHFPDSRGTVEDAIDLGFNFVKRVGTLSESHRRQIFAERSLKISKTFKGSTESRKALEKLKSTDRVMNPLTKIRTEAGLVQLIQDLVKTVLDNEGMQMSPSRTFDALDRVKRSFELKNESLIREYIREIILESEPATTGTMSTVGKITKRIGQSIEQAKNRFSDIFKRKNKDEENKDEENKDESSKDEESKAGENKSQKKMSDATEKILKNPAAKAALRAIETQPVSALSGEQIAFAASLNPTDNTGNSEQKNSSTEKKNDSLTQNSTSNQEGKPKLKNA